MDKLCNIFVGVPDHDRIVNAILASDEFKSLIISKQTAPVPTPICTPVPTPTPIVTPPPAVIVQKVDTRADNIPPPSVQVSLTLQVADAYGVPVPDTAFTVIVDVSKNGNNVTLNVPAVNFQTGQFANDASEEDPNYDPDAVPPMSPYYKPGLEGGYLYTVSGEIPVGYRPSGLMPAGTEVASTTNTQIPFHFIQDPHHDWVSLGVEYQNPPVPGYQATLDKSGSLSIVGSGTPSNIIPAGMHSLLPFSLNYVVHADQTPIQDAPIDIGITDIGSSSNSRVKRSNIRDSHINAIYNGIVAESWTSNAAVLDKSLGLPIDAYVSVGKVNPNGIKQMGTKINISQLGPFQLAWDTAVAINPLDPQNIVCSYGVVNLSSSYKLVKAEPWVAVSQNGGTTWTKFPTQYQDPDYTQGFGDNRGVMADKFGNFWYLSSTRYDVDGNLIIQPYLMLSTDRGMTWSKVWTAPNPTMKSGIVGGYDFAQVCLGTNDAGVYGIYLCTDTFPDGNFGTDNDSYVMNVFIPIDGQGVIVSGIKISNLTGLLNSFAIGNITASNDGRVWQMGAEAGALATLWPSSQSGINEIRILYKSPGELDVNYAGPWAVAQSNLSNVNMLVSQYKSLPRYGFFTAPQTILYDNNRRALYALVSIQTPMWSQNVTNCLLISRNNGSSWSDPIQVGTSTQNNRGFASMSLDPIQGHLSISWYDGRVDPIKQFGLQYYGALILGKNLDLLVNSIPLSNPVYKLPSLDIEGPNTIVDVNGNFVGGNTGPTVYYKAARKQSEVKAASGTDKGEEKAPSSSQGVEKKTSSNQGGKKASRRRQRRTGRFYFEEE